MVLFQDGQGGSHRLRRFIDNAVCIVILVVVPLLLLWPALTRGEAPIGVDSVLSFAPWEEARPSVAMPIDDAHMNLMAQRIYPWYAHMESATGYKDLLWNPLESCGLPFMALWRTRCLSPFSLPFYFLDILVALQISVLAKLLVAGFCAFYAARRLGFARPIALFVALSFQMSGHLALWCAYPISDVIPWLPLVILFCERLALNHPRVWSRGALAFALMLLGGDPETLAAVLLFSVVYLALRFTMDLRPVRDWFSPVTVFAISLTLAVGLAAIQILPFIEFLGESAKGGRAPASYFPQLHDLISAFLPSGFGTATAATFAEAESRRVAGLLHVGIAPVLMLPVWFSLRRFASTRQRRRIEALMAAATMMLALAMCAQYLVEVPVLRFLNPEHYLAPGAFVLALVAAATMEEWLHLNAEDCMASLRRLLFVGPLFAVLAVGVVVAGHQGLAVSMGAYGWK
ncbi:MAG: YfhO family protein, partial [Candidatus Hydrogenedentales bacterium]